jgi:hypothetical protein
MSDPRALDDAVDAAAGQLLIELAFLVPKGTDLTAFGERLVAYKQAIEARAAAPKMRRDKGPNEGHDA